MFFIYSTTVVLAVTPSSHQIIFSKYYFNNFIMITVFYMYNPKKVKESAKNNINILNIKFLLG